MAKKTAEVTSLDIPAIEREAAKFGIVGTTPFIFNRLSQKAQRELLLPSKKKTTVEKAGSLKHNPPKEYRDSVYTTSEGDTALCFPATAFKKSLASSALRIPGAKKTEIGQLVRIHGYRVPIWGIPQVYMTGVRSADMNKTPDIRTRAIVNEWATTIEVSFIRPLLTLKAIMNLFVAAGEIMGVGDGRQEKGALDFGSFRIVQPGDEDYIRICKTGGRDEQLAALDEPTMFDDETSDLWSWWHQEAKDREMI